MDNGPHFRYISDIWHPYEEIKNETVYKYVLDIIDHFRKWYQVYLLKRKKLPKF